MMKTATASVGLQSTFLSLVLISIVGLISCKNESVAEDVQAEDLELRALLEARRDLLKEAFEYMTARDSVVGAGTAELSLAETSFLEAELEAAATWEEQIACLQRLLDAYQRKEQRVEALSNSGVVQQSELNMATVDRLKAEANLFTAKHRGVSVVQESGGTDPDVVQKTDEAALRGLLEMRRDILKLTVESWQSEVDKRMGSNTVLPGLHFLLLPAELDLASCADEGIAVLEKHLEVQTKLEERAEAGWKNGSVHEMNLLVATTCRTEVAIKLCRVRQGRWPLIFEGPEPNQADA